jgi:hypothetical protein
VKRRRPKPKLYTDVEQLLRDERAAHRRSVRVAGYNERDRGAGIDSNDPAGRYLAALDRRQAAAAGKRPPAPPPPKPARGTGRGSGAPPRSQWTRSRGAVASAARSTDGLAAAVEQPPPSEGARVPPCDGHQHPFFATIVPLRTAPFEVCIGCGTRRRA